MPSTVVNYDLLISCPGDVEDAVEIVKEVVDDFNQKYLDTLNLSIRIRYWKNSSFPESGGKPQELLNKQFVNDADLAVAIFKTKFGTPTDKYGSGSEEEIELMLKDGKQVFMYFDDSPVSPSTINNEQYQKVLNFKEKYQDLGIYYTFTSPEEFRKKFDAHITKYFMSLDAVNELKNNNASELKILANNNGTLEKDAMVCDFDLGKFPKIECVLEEIKEYYAEIPTYKMEEEILDPFQAFNKKVSIESGTKEIINSFANQLEIKFDDSFFDLGNLKESVLVSNSLMGKSLVGSKDERNKYDKILLLKKRIVDLLGYFEIEKLYSNLKGIQLVLANNGKTYDEDIDVELILPIGVLKHHDELVVPKENVSCDDWCFEDIFEIPECREFISYGKTKRKEHYFNHSVNMPIMPFQTRDYESEYRDTIDDIFEYDYYSDEDSEVVKVHFDYLKHNQKAALPTWLFIREDSEFPVEVEYRIISKNNPNIQSGKLMVRKK